MHLNKTEFVAQQFGYNVVPKSYTNGNQQSGVSSVGSNNSRRELFDRLNSLDRPMDKGINPYAAAPKVTAPTASQELQSTEKAQKNTGLEQQFVDGKLLRTDAMKYILSHQDKLDKFNPKDYEDGKVFNLGDREFHPVYNELILDEMA
mgnify:CR=1 FL=1